jgi:drug/metabolite transporter (DMT)-like permease
VSILLGLLASLLIGTSDFLGAKAAGHSTPLQATTMAFAGGGFVALLYSPLLGTPTVRDLTFGAISGVAVCIALTTLWHGYKESSLGVAGPVAAVVSTVLPVLYDAARGEVPGPIGWLGIAIGVAALVLTSWTADGENMLIGVTLGGLSGLAFAAMFIISVSTSEESGTWPIVSQRATALVLAGGAGLLLHRRPIATGNAVGWSALAGACGASGVAAIVFGGQRGSITQVVVAGSMYPAVAIALGWIFLGDRLRGRQVVGLLAALLGVALIALG